MVKPISGACKERTFVDDLLLSTSIFRYPVPMAQKAHLLAAVRGGLSIRHKAATEGDIQCKTLFRLHRSCACRAAIFSWPLPWDLYFSRR